VEELLAERGVAVTHETIGQWVRTRPIPSYGGRWERGTTRRGWSSPTSSPVTQWPLRHVLLKTEHRRHKGLNNRAENSHLPKRQRERRMQRFKSPEQAPRFLEPFSTVCNHFRLRRHRPTADAYRQLMGEQRQIWREVTAVPAAR
jgi:transposase-like protein